jgi:phospholipid/cholesterol/gamma-HCH transport system ATP-binding protein
MNANTNTSTNEIALELKGVRKSFGAKRIYDDMDLTVYRGETLTVLGPSGSGKSVLLKLIIGLEKPDGGQILIDGVNTAPLKERELRDVRRKVGMLFQGAALFDSMTVGENVAYGLQEHFNWPDEKIAARVSECLEWVGLPHIEAREPSSLSGGMKKRVGLARALAPGPEVILYDEPTTGLDPANSRRINELIVSLQKRLKVTSLVITHDIESAFHVSNRIGLVKDHKITSVTDTEEAKKQPPEDLEAFLEGELVEESK